MIRSIALYIIMIISSIGYTSFLRNRYSYSALSSFLRRTPSSSLSPAAFFPSSSSSSLGRISLSAALFVSRTVQGQVQVTATGQQQSTLSFSNGTDTLLSSSFSRNMSSSSSSSSSTSANFSVPGLPSTMKCYIVENNVCTLTHRPLPVPKSGEVLLRIHYTAVNRADILQRQGKYPPPPGATDILGLEAVGEIVHLPDTSLSTDRTGLTIGSRVMALLSGGGYAEYVTVPFNHLVPIPSSLSYRTAAAIPETWLTAYQLLFLVGKGQPGETVVIHAAGSGVGTAAVQLASKAGMHVIAIAGSDDKLVTVKTLGAKETINYKSPGIDVAQLVKTYTDNKGADLILDPIGASFTKINSEAIRMDGRWVLFGSMGGLVPDGPFLGAILRKRIQLLGTTLRNRDDGYKANLVDQFNQHVLPLISNGTYTPVIETELPLENIMDAHALIESNITTGKVILKVCAD